jgi:hypothetical protein
VALVNSQLNTSKCLQRNRKVEVITISTAWGRRATLKDFSGGFIDPIVALSQLQKLQFTDSEGISSCSGTI